MKPRRSGRPPKLTEEIVRSIGDAIARGATEQEACDIQDPPVLLNSFRAAIKRNASFAREIRIAKTLLMLDSLKALEAGAEGWQSRAWILERRYWDIYGRRDALKIDHRGEIGIAGVPQGVLHEISTYAQKTFNAEDTLKTGAKDKGGPVPA